MTFHFKELEMRRLSQTEEMDKILAVVNADKGLGNTKVATDMGVRADKVVSYKERLRYLRVLMEEAKEIFIQKRGSFLHWYPYAYAIDNNIPRQTAKPKEDQHTNSKDDPECATLRQRTVFINDHWIAPNMRYSA
jgi:hypothetical protein